jgi:hypothetical protein
MHPNYHGPRTQLELQHHLPPTEWKKISSFTHIALSDEYLALATTEKVLIFNLAGERTGRWLFCDQIQHGTLKSLAFSPDGSKLVALYSLDKKRERPYEAARFYPTRDFRNEGGHVKSLQDVSHSPEVTWQISPIYEPSRIAFSLHGDMVAITTGYSLEGKAYVRMLGENATTRVWSYWCERSIKVNNPEYRHEMVGWGVTGLSLYFPDSDPSNVSFRNEDCLAISLDSTDPAAHDCYRIKNKGRGYELVKFTQIATGPTGTTNMAIAASLKREAVALLGKDGKSIVRT